MGHVARGRGQGRLSRWPTNIANAGNAGVLVVGHSAEFGSAAVLLGGRFYTRRQVYEYTDFGGGVDKSERARGAPESAAFRELAEELFGVPAQEAPELGRALWTSVERSLVGGCPLVSKSYAMFIVPAEPLVEAVEALGLSSTVPSSAMPRASAIDVLAAVARRNSELTSVALIDVGEFLQAQEGNGAAAALSVRSLDGEERSSAIQLRYHSGKGVSPEEQRDAVARFFGDAATKRAKESKDIDGIAASQAAATPLVAAVGAASFAEQHQGAATEELRWQLLRYQAWPGTALTETASGQADVAAAPLAARSNLKLPAAAAELPMRPKRVLPRSAAGGSGRSVPYIFDMETGDPDDVLTLLFIASHPSVELRAVTITPGSGEQVSLVRWLLQELGLIGVRLGATRWPENADKHGCLRGNFYRAFGRSPEGEPKCEDAATVLLECCDERTTLVTGAAVTNLGAALELDRFCLGRWVAQGGFAGEGVVPRSLQMPKFEGMETCPTWNFNGNPKAAQAALQSPQIGRRVCVSKNVCHRVVYDEAWHARLSDAAAATAAAAAGTRRAKAFEMMRGSMGAYLERNPGGKKLHDPLALAVALDESVCSLVEVELFRGKGGWGSRPARGSSTWISIDYDPKKFQAVLLDG